MKTLSSDRFPTFNDEMIQEVAGEIVKLAHRGGARGMRIDFDFVRDALDGSEELARAVLRRAGFKPCSKQWATGRGNSEVSSYTYPPLLAERMADILEDYDFV